MRQSVLSIGILLLALGAARAQSSSGGGNVPQIPYGQTFKDFQFPYYQDGQLKFTLFTLSAKGTTINRAEATELKIELYDQGKVTTTITSPKADLYVADKRMRTKNTVQIERADMEATAQTCDFDLAAKKYLLREDVKVTLKNFDVGGKANLAADSAPSSTPPVAPVRADRVLAPAPPTLAPRPSNPARDDTLLETPGAIASTNAPPAVPPSPVKP